MFKMLEQHQIETMTPAKWLDELERLQRHLNQMDVYGAWLFSHAEQAGAAATEGERKLVDALKKRLGISRAEANKRRRTARAAKNEKIRKGMEGGDLNADQANDLASADIDETERDRLTDEATREPADTTREKTKAAEHEASQRRGEDPTARQRGKRTAKTFIDADEMWNLHLKLDAETGARTEARIKAINKELWRQDKTGGPDADRTPQQRMADAAAQAILEQRASQATSGDSKTPAPRPAPPDITVAIPIDWLIDKTNDQKISLTNTGIALTASAIRRLACDANIIPIILGSAGQILDQGRDVRTATKAQRRALELRDGGCLWPGCNTPPSDCDAHHIKHWVHGGNSDLDNLSLFCWTHHRLIHEGGYELWKHTDQPGFAIHDSAGNPCAATQNRHLEKQNQSSPTDLSQRRHQRDRQGTRDTDPGVTWDEPQLFESDTG
ncbi:MAG: hypothetical protein ACI91O_000507 [Candidatus Poriferisodalaceae bacterium]